MSGNTLLTPAEAAAMLGDGVEEHHVRARVRRGTLAGELHGDDWLIPSKSVEQALSSAPPCEVCGLPCTVHVIVKYRHHDHVQFELCTSHGSEAASSYGRQGQAVLEVASFPFQSEAWLKPSRR